MLGVHQRGNWTFPHSILQLFITSDFGPYPQEVKHKCNRKRWRWLVGSPACKSRSFLWGQATLEDEVCLLWEKTLKQYTCHNIDTYEEVGWDPSSSHGSLVPSWPQTPETPNVQSHPCVLTGSFTLSMLGFAIVRSASDGHIQHP